MLFPLDRRYGGSGIYPDTAASGRWLSYEPYEAESPGPSVGKLLPKVQSTAKILYKIYIALTVALIILLLLGGMPLYDSLCAAFGTAGTGGSESNPTVWEVTAYIFRSSSLSL